METHAKIVVIGGGVVGCSILFHLAKFGLKDCILLERKELTSGSSWHAAGNVHVISSDPNISRLMAYTINLYKEIEKTSGQSVGFKPSGGFYLASNEVWHDYLKRERSKARYMGLDQEFISLEDVVKKNPIIDPKHYIAALWDPIDGGNHNHKTFSVLTYGDTIWVGTANGINRGIFGTGFCVDWEHYSYPTHGLSGNFVVGLALQMHKGKRVIWAATVNADDPTEQRGVSYTTNDGLSWNTALLGERVYNITAHDSLVFAATAKGLWKTEDGINWARYNPARQAIPVPNTAINSTDEVLANEVYSVAFDSGDNSIWIGTGDGAAHSHDLDGLNWKIFRAEYDRDEVYAYPNPFSPYTHNVIGGDGYVRFHTNEWSGTFVIDLDVYNFAMEKVFAGSFDRRDASSGALKWNGRDTQGRLVDNGVYFVKLKYPENQTSKPSAHWVKLIVVK